MFNVVKGNLYRLKKNKRYASSILLMYVIGLVGIVSLVHISVSKEDVAMLGWGIERLIMSCCLVVLPICFINFFFKRDELGLNKKELIILKKRIKMIGSDGFTILFSTIIVVYIFLLLASITLMLLGSYPPDFFNNIFMMGVKITLLITAITDFAMIFEYLLGSFLLPVMLIILIITGNMHLIVKFLLALIGYQRFSVFTLSGIAVYYEYKKLTYILLIIYIFVYKSISSIIISRKEY